MRHAQQSGDVGKVVVVMISDGPRTCPCACPWTICLEVASVRAIPAGGAAQLRRHTNPRQLSSKPLPARVPLSQGGGT
jgi:hypothetical protein